MTEPTQPTAAELDKLIIAASRELIAAQRARDQARIDIAYAEYRRLLDLKASLYG